MDRSDPRHPAQAKLPRSRRWLLYVVFGFFVLVLGAYLIGTEVGSAALERQLADLREDGAALSLEELHDRQPVVPDAQNSVRVIVTFAPELQGLDRRDSRYKHLPFLARQSLPMWNEPWEAETVEAISAYVSTHGALIARIDEVHDLPTGRFDTNLSVYTSLDPAAGKADPRLFGEVRTAAKIEALAALHDSFQGRADSAVRRVETQLNLADPPARDLSLLGALVSCAIEHMAVLTTERLLASDTLSVTSLNDLEAAFRRILHRPTLERGLRGERLIAIGMIKEGMALAGKQAAPNRQQIPGILRALGGGWGEHQQAKVLEWYRPIIEAGDDYAQTLRAAREMDTEYGNTSAYFAMAKITVPSLSRAIELWGRRTGLVRSAIAALAVERYRLERGAWPESLAVLVPEHLPKVPLDPFDGQPLRYRRTDTGIIIYSIGEDGYDNEGYVEVAGKPGKQGPDIGFRLLDPELRGFRVVRPIDDAEGDAEGRNAD